MDKILLQKLLMTGIFAAKSAGKEILKVYKSSFNINYKKDRSPVTEADKKANSVINEILREHFNDIPIISEEGKNISYETRNKWGYYWLVDPLDGTKDFIKRNDEFTVNIALVSSKKPVLGIVYLPAKDIFYYSLKGFGSFKIDNSNKLIYNHLNNFNVLMDLSEKLPLRKNNNKEIKVVVSRSNFNTTTENYVQKLQKEFNNTTTISAGSSLKICLVAEGIADVYPRFAPTMEWDTAAGHAIIKEAGGDVIDINKREPLKYNKEQLINPPFIVFMEENYFLIKYIN